MKKLLRSLLAVMLVAMMAIAFTSCAKPEKVEDKLKDMDYEVDLLDDEDDIDEYLEEMELDLDGVTAIVEAWDEEDDAVCSVTIFWFKKKADAEDAVETIEEYIDAMLDELGDYVNELKDYMPEVASNGKIVVVGNGDVFDDACDIVKAK